MEFKNTLKNWQKYLSLPRRPKRKSVLYLIISLPILLNSLAIIGLFKYDNDRHRADNFVNNYTKNISDRLIKQFNNDALILDYQSQNLEMRFYDWLLNQYLPEIYPNSLPQIAILNSDRTLIADNFQNLETRSPTANRSLTQYLKKNLRQLSDPTQTTQFDFQTKQHEFWGRITPWKNRVLDSNWYVVVIAAESSNAGDLTGQNQNSAFTSYLPYLLAIALLGLIIYGQIAWWAIADSNPTPSNLTPSEPRENLPDKTIDRQAYTLLANMSHELRSPLNAILGFVQIIDQELSVPRSSRDNLAIIHRSGERLLSIINNVIDLAKIETERLTLEPNNIDFYSWLDITERSLKLQAQNHNWEFLLNKGSSIPQYIYIDENRLRQIVENLVEGCLDSSTTRTMNKISLQVGCEAIDESPSGTKQKLCFTVVNANYSISETELSTLFDPSVTVKQKKQPTKGSSLNLPISLQLARLMGGSLTASNHSKSLAGLIFHLSIPVTIPAAQDLPVKPLHKKVIGLKSERSEYRILVVDDSRTNRKIMVQLLEPVGFQVREAVNGREAVDVWLSWQPDLIWMDLRMPVMDGYEATERIKSYAKTPQAANRTSIVALSASTLEEEKSLFIKAGCDDFVGKPFSENIIFDKIAQHLGIEYIYESVTPVEVTDFKLTADALEIMSEEWLNRLEAAAVVLDRDLVMELLQEIPSEQSDLQNALQRQVDNFDFDLILNLASQKKNESKRN